jgi:hypothetical protein
MVEVHLERHGSALPDAQRDDEADLAAGERVHPPGRVAVEVALDTADPHPVADDDVDAGPREVQGVVSITAYRPGATCTVEPAGAYAAPDSTCSTSAPGTGRLYWSTPPDARGGSR